MSVSGDQRVASARRFPSPLEVVIPADSAGWEEMYAYHVPFRRDHSEDEEGRFWFQEALHAPEPLHPFDAVAFDYAAAAFSHAASRLFVLPDSLGVQYRILNGYVYISANAVTDPVTIDRRAELFSLRSTYYYEHWDEIYELWLEKVETATEELLRLEVPALPEFEPDSMVSGGGGGLGAAQLLLAAWDQLMDGLDRIFHFHFELLHLGYDAYLVFYELCREAFPDVDDQTFAKMLGAIDVLVLRPDEELRRLARRAVELRLADSIRAAPDEESLIAALSGSESGREWLTDYEETKDPWFYFSCGTGTFYHHHRSWIDDPALPISTIGSYIERLETGAEISRPAEAILAERERITRELRGLLPEGSRTVFDERLALARKVFPYVENHNFYIDHRYMTIFWNKVRDFGALLAQIGVLVDSEDIFYLRHDEIRSALEDVRLWWSSGAAAAPRGSQHWPPIVARRKLIHGAMRRWSPPNALGRVPDRITEPITVMLWGITEERIAAWLSPGEGTERISGIPGSPGVIEGRARVVIGADELNQIEHGEVLVAPTTSTSWTPVFGRIAGAVLDIGGVMSHAAIVAREYGLPAVIGTGTATKRIRSGDLVRVDADAGIVTILERARSG